MDDRPVCGKCGQVMTPEDARLRPEMFLHDACLPGELHPQEPTVCAAESPGPQTHLEALQFYEGFLAGATAYCAAVGHSCLKRNNPKLREVFDAQGWKTIEMYERLSHICEHGVKDGD